MSHKPKGKRPPVSILLGFMEDDWKGQLHLATEREVTGCLHKAVLEKW